MISITVKSDEEIPLEGELLLAMEELLRATTKLDIRVFKDKMGDDSKIRQKMTQEERNKL